MALADTFVRQVKYSGAPAGDKHTDGQGLFLLVRADQLDVEPCCRAWNGNVNFTSPRGRNSAHRIASYIAKYVGKGLADAVFNAKSYWSSTGIVMPKPVRLWFHKDTLTWDIVSLLAHDFLLRGYRDLA